MKDQLISFETAKLAKEKGFDIIQRYGIESSLYKKTGEHTYYANYGVMYYGLSEGYISAPTQSLLQKWLREKHNLNIEIAHVEDMDWYFIVHKIPCKYKDKSLAMSDGFETYEEALEFALNEALQLIK